MSDSCDQSGLCKQYFAPLFFEMLIHRSILSRHSSHRWQHGWIEACAMDKAETADVSKPQREETGSLATNNCNRVNNT